jgi:hemoglobin-like flavoprotein
MARQESEANAAGFNSRSFQELYDHQLSLSAKVEIEICNDILKIKKTDNEALTKKLIASLEEVLSFGTPKPDENPNMYVAWEKAHKLLAEVSSP